ncbi:EF-hand domain-containing protein [Novosphingobium sp.]|uniref:EF-hand domain-containing protein n=1 Tax=Novosphingobium sp. TaxID=1874826 RepID=UPI00286D7A6F|nr:EF-hand domain-containing protein [Novosphingobium sp.]
MLRNPFVRSFIAVLLLAGSGQAFAQTARPRPAPAVKVPVQVPAQPAPQPRPPVAAAPQVPDMPRASFIAQMDAEHRKRDTDGDGKITRAELERWERGLLIAQAQAGNRALFARLDADRNGVLTPGEFAALVQDPGNPDVGPMMTRFDGNRDQVITMIEYRAATLANFDRLDTDKDGVLTGAEINAVPPRPVGR